MTHFIAKVRQFWPWLAAITRGYLHRLVCPFIFPHCYEGLLYTAHRLKFGLRQRFAPSECIICWVMCWT